MARIDFPPIVGVGQIYKDDNGVVWATDSRKRWVRNTRTGGIGPPVAPGDVIYYAGSEIDQNALTSKLGDICIRTDQKPNRTYKQKTTTNTGMGSWQTIGFSGHDFGLLT